MVASLEFSGGVNSTAGDASPGIAQAGAFHAPSHSWPTTRGRGIAWRGFHALLHSAVERQLDESAPETAPVGTTILSVAAARLSTEQGRWSTVAGRTPLT